MTLPFYGASFGTAVRRFFKGYAQLEGRASASEYYWANLFVLLLSIPVSIAFFVAAVVSVKQGVQIESFFDFFRWALTRPALIGVAVVGGLFVGALWLPMQALAMRRVGEVHPPRRYGSGGVLGYGAPTSARNRRWVPPPAPGGTGARLGGARPGTANPGDATYGASFATALRCFFAGYARFGGRASKSEYWWAQLFVAIVSLVCVTVFVVVVMTQDDTVAAPVFAVLVLLSLSLTPPTYALGWRRLHDAGWDGWLYFSLGASPLIGLLPTQPEP